MVKKVLRRQFMFEKPVFTRVGMYKFEKELIMRAAAAEGLSMGAFMVRAAKERAQNTKDNCDVRTRRGVGASPGISAQSGRGPSATSGDHGQEAQTHKCANRYFINNNNGVVDTLIDSRCQECKRDSKQFCGKCMREVLCAQT
jgi:hypothetical protein